MFLEDLPEKTLNRLLKSVTWTEVQRVLPNKHWMRRFISRVAQSSRWITGVLEKGYSATLERMIDRLRRGRTTATRVRD